MELVIDNDLRSAIVTHMLECEPNECVGLITLSEGYVRLENVHPEPLNNFKVEPQVSKRVVSDPDVIAYVHSHPAGLMCPSKMDMETQINIGKPSIIAARDPNSQHIEVFQFGDHILDMPLEGMAFRDNVYDCFEQARRYYWQMRGVKLRSVPREPKFWLLPREGNPDLYAGFEAMGFEEFDPKETPVEEGDGILCQTDGSPVLNHAGIYIGGNKMLHHRIGRKSGHTPVHFYASHIRKWIRLCSPK